MIYEKVIRPTYVTRAMVQKSKNVTFVFGDNVKRCGMGGQAGAMRGEPNAIGVPTKWEPSNAEYAFFTDADWPEVGGLIVGAFDILTDIINAGGIVAIPADGLGTGFSELPTRAPQIYAHIEDLIKKLEAL